MGDAINSGIDSLIATTTAIFSANAVDLFAIFGILIALGLVLRLVKRFVGRRA